MNYAASSHRRRLKGKFFDAIVCSAALFATWSVAAQTAPPREPIGIYAIPDIIGCVSNPNEVTNSATGECLSNNILALLSNPAISGIAAFVPWNDISLTIPTNSLTGTTDWNVLDDIFGAVAQWNANNPGNVPKTIQLGLLPGFWTPQWVFNNLAPCDAMFITNSQGTIIGVNPANVSTNCGCASFLNAGNETNPAVMPLPLPWHDSYKNAFTTFIQAVAQRYGTNPLLVTVYVTGPTAYSAEMILPNERSDPVHFPQWNPLIALEFPKQPQLTNSDMLFINQWKDAIDLFGAAFTNVTLCVTTGGGLPNFLNTNGVCYTNYSVPPGFAPDCADTNLAIIMDAAAEATVLAYFATPQIGGNNAKASQADGMTASQINLYPLGGGDLGSFGVKWLAQSTATGSAPLPGTSNVVSQVLSGLQLDSAIAANPQSEGCNQPGGCPTNAPISPQQAIYNVLQVCFDGTPLGGSYFVNSSNLPVNYLQIYAADVLYAETNAIAVPVVDAAGNTNSVTAQMELAGSLPQIYQTAEPPLFAPVLTQPGRTNAQFGFTLLSEPWLYFEILATTNIATPMADWTALATITNVTGAFSFTDPATNLNQRFYQAHQLSYPRRPLGVYAKTVISDVVQHNPGADWNPYFNCYYAQLLANPAVSGLLLQIHWDLVETNSGGYDWCYVQDAFDQVSIWNSNNPDAQKNIQFIVTPGFNSPGWVLTNVMAADGSCDSMLTNMVASPDCGTVTFVGYNENADGDVLPLPWDPTYKFAWSNFLSALNQKFGDNPLLVSISIAGPTAGSEEMIMPNDENTCPCHATNGCDANCGSPQPQPNGLTPSQIWNQLLLNHYGPAYTNSNRAFVEEWTNAINLYEGIFHNLTLVVTPGNGDGFPFDSATSSTNPLCQYSTNSSCTAVACVLNYFENFHSVNGNGKACQVSGLSAGIVTLTNGDVGMAGVRYLSAQQQTANPWEQIVGGAQFDHGFSFTTDPEQEEFNVLANFFNGTLGVNGTTTLPGLFTNVADESTVNIPLTTPAPLNYLQVYNQDVLYSESNGCVVITNGPGGQTISVSAQDLLNAANQLLFTIGQKPYPPGAVPVYSRACSNSPPPACTPP